VSLWTRANRGFNRIEVDVSVKGAREGQTIVIVDAVPSNELVTRWKASAQLTLAVDTGFKFAIGTSPTPAAATTPVVAGAHAELGAGAKLLLGPLEYALRTPVVTRSGLGLDSVTWRLERESFASENDPGLQLVIRIPRPAASLVVSVRMIATRYARLFGDGFLRAIEDLPQVVQDFFRRGTPIFASGDWELSSEL
jgi:hypothetical protein